ncbi:MAG: hypothetical protein DDT32_00280 [Syntrophomonadaceae bacterium]|nr:hypothetical protein [Bacillota bacterium]
MLGVTHLIAGAAASSVILGSDISGMALAAAGALLPDIDTADSIASRSLTLGRLRGPLGIMLFGAGIFISMPVLTVVGGLFLAVSILPHRGVTHSLLAVVLLWLYAPLPFVIGYASHLVLDALSGRVPFFWPLGQRFGIRVPAGDILAGALSIALLVGRYQEIF